jgi:phosphohistidine phosphatase
MGGLPGAEPLRVYFVQHGDAVPERLDPERPLSAVGRREVHAVARLLADTGVRPAHVVHSGKLRAQQTAELLATAVAPGRVPEAIAGLNPNDSVEPMVRRIADWTSDVMLVGHLPFMGKARGPSRRGRRGQAGRRLRPGDRHVPRTGRGEPLDDRVDGAPGARSASRLSRTIGLHRPGRRVIAAEEQG